MAQSANHPHGHAGETGETRRDFLTLTAGAIGGIGAVAFILPFINSMNPAADTLALASTEVDISAIKAGQSVTVTWRGKPVFIRHRTDEEIKLAEATPLNQLPDPEADKVRVKKSQWLILVGICTHLGCVPNGQKPGEARGDFGGWFCPCHGSHYDTSGRIRKGPAPRNLEVPQYAFLSDTSLRIG